MRIGIDCRLWNETGVGRYVRNLVWELAKIDHNNKYILFFKDNEYKNVQIPAENFEKRLANIHWHSLKEQIFLAKVLYKEKLDIVHFTYFSVPILYPNPFIITIHDLIINHFPTGKASTRAQWIYWLKVLSYKIVLFFSIKNARKIIAVSETTKKEIIQHYKKNSEDIIVTLEGVDKKISNIKNQSRLNRDQISNVREKYFLYVGNAYPHKNLEKLVEAYALLRLRGLKLILVGKKDFFYIRLKQKVEEMGLSESILFYEKVSDAGLANLYLKAIALIAPSLMEGFGLPVLEAMASNCPVVCSNIDAYKEICADAAVYFDPKDINDIKEKLEYILQNEELRKQFVKKGLERAKHFSWAKMAQETLSVYASLLSRATLSLPKESRGI